MAYFGEPEGLCCVCQQPLPQVHFAECMGCFQQFHLRMTETERNAVECGVVYTHDEDLYLIFLCYSCFQGQQPTVPQPNA